MSENKQWEERRLEPLGTESKGKIAGVWSEGVQPRQRQFGCTVLKQILTLHKLPDSAAAENDKLTSLLPVLLAFWSNYENKDSRDGSVVMSICRS